MFQNTSRRAISLALLLVASITFQSFAFMPGGVAMAQKLKPLSRVPAGKPNGITSPTPPSASITATKVDAWDDTATPDGKAEPGQTITYTVTITNTGASPATGVTFTDTVDSNTTLVPGSVITQPIAVPDSYNVIGNVRIQPNAAAGLLANDVDPDTGNNTGLTASGPTTTTQGGNLNINADGSFVYNPAPGFAGTDTFTYTITDPTSKTDTAVATLKVGNGTASPGTNVVWFVDPAAPSGGDGRLTSPFNCYTGGTASCFSQTAADDPGDTIFLYSGAHTGGYTLLSTQKLIGAGASATLASISGLTVPTGSDALPSTGGASPTMTTTNVTAVPLGIDNTLRGFTIGDVGTGTKISGVSFGTLTVGNNTTPDMILNGTGQALNLSTGTLAATSAFASVTTTSSSGQGINLTAVGGTLAMGSTTISGSTTQGILVGTTTAAINFGNTSVSGGTDGVSLQNNSSGTRTFGTLSISNNSGIGFLSGAGGGNVSVTGTTLIPAAAQTAPVGTGIDINALAAGTSVTFADVTVNKGNAGTGVSLGTAANQNLGNVTFNSLGITASNGTGLVSAANTATTGSITVTTNSGSISATNGPAINITKTVAPATPITLNFTTVSSTNSGTQGINLDRVSGNATIGTTTSTNPTGVGVQVQNTSAGGTMNFGNTTSNTSGATGVNLASNAGAVTFNDLDIAPDTNVGGFAVANSSGTTTSSTGTITTTDATAVSVTNSALAMILTSVSTDNTGDADSCISLTTATGTINMQGGTLVGGNSAAFLINGGTVTSTYSGTITQNTTAQRAIDVQNKTGGTSTFAGLITASTTTANAVHVVSNTGATITFSGGMTLTTTNGTGFNATGGGTVNVSGTNNINSSGGSGIGVNWNGVSSASTVLFNNVTSSSGAAVSITSSAATDFTLNDVTSTTGTAVAITTASGDFIFHAINATGATKGISVNSATGTFTVNGTSTTDASGGTILNCTQRGAEFISSNNITLKNMNFTGNGTAATGSDDNNCSLNTGLNTGCHAGVHLQSVTTATLDNLNVVDGNQIGINGATVSGLTLQNSSILRNGDESGEAGVQMEAMSGTNNFTSNILTDNSGHQMELLNYNTAGLSPTINITSNQFSFTSFPGGAQNGNTPPAGITSQAIFAQQFTTGTMTITITSNSFTRIWSAGIQLDNENGGNMLSNVGIQSNRTTPAANTFTDCGLGATVSGGNNGTNDFYIANNSFTNNTAVTGTSTTTQIVASRSQGASGNWTGQIRNNTIGTPGTIGSGCYVVGCNGIEMNNIGASGTYHMEVTSNQVNHVNGSGILGDHTSGSSVASGSTTFVITGNTIQNPEKYAGNPGDITAAGNGINLTNGDNIDDTGAMCAEISGNTINGAWGNGQGVSNNDSIRIRRRSTAAGSFKIRNYVPDGTPDDTEAMAFVATQNTFGPGTVDQTGSSNNSLTAPQFSGGSTACPLLLAEGGVLDTLHQPSLLDNLISFNSEGATFYREAQPSAAETANIVSSLEQNQLDTLVTAAIQRWSDAGLTAEQIAALRGIRFEVSDLAGSYLGEADGNTIQVDRYAAGKGWFVDPNPFNDSTFGLRASATRSFAHPRSYAAGHVDLLTTIEHEMGHRLGLEDTYLAQDRENIMYGYLAVGERRMPTWGQALVSRTHTLHKAHHLSVEPAALTPGSGGTVNVTIGTLAPGDSVTITFQVVIDDPYLGGANVSNQGSVSGSNPSAFTNFTDDPAVGGTADPTLTPINSTNIGINNAKQAEPVSPNTIDMVFTVSLSSPATGAVSVNFQTADDTATAGTCGNPGADYVTTSGTVNFTAGQQVKTINVPICSDGVVEGDEQFFVNLSGASGGTLVDNQAIGTITVNTPGTFLISELRTSGPGGLGDDFVELYNNTDSALTVAASDASAGYGLYKMGATCNDTPVLIGTIPNGTVIPARGHYLVVGSQYSLANYGGTGAAAGNLTMTQDIESDRNVGVFSTANIVNVSSANRLDAVGFGTNTGAVCDLLREPSNLGAVSGSNSEHSFFRKECDFVSGVGCTTPGNPKDTNDNSADFMFADRDGTFISGVPQHLGAPGPENLASPLRRDNTGINITLLDNTKTSSAVPNRVRDFTSNPGNNSTFGTLSVRRRVVNNTGGNVTRLRFRIVELTTFPSPGGGVADLRAITSVNVAVSGVGDAATCTAAGAGAPPCSITVKGTTLETPPAQPNGGGFNSTMSDGTITLGTPLANGASANVQFLLGIQQTGSFRFYIIIEALP